MAIEGPIVIVDDDIDDQEILQEALSELGIKNKAIHFRNGEDALLYLETTDDQPFLILCDVNMPKMNGIEFKRRIDEHPKLRSKSIPFIFLTTTVNELSVLESYQHLTVQGFFKKSERYRELKELLSIIMDYWRRCYHPNR